MITRRALLPAVALLFLASGFLARSTGTSAADAVWTTGLVLAGGPLVVRTILGLARGRLASDVVASLAIVGALLLHLPLAGLVVALMQSGGEALEEFASARASKALRELEAEAPRVAHLVDGDAIRDVSVEAVLPGQRIMVRPGEMVPCDGVVETGDAAVDRARVTGEPVPLHALPGSVLQSGSLVLDGPLRVRVTARSQESLYAGIVALVRSAQASKAPFQRLADRAAIWFTPLTLAVCALAWIVSHDPTRVLAVLVVATPCPLILAAPVAFVGGINRAAARGIVVRHGGALEALANVDVAVVDKTGTVTHGVPALAEIEPVPELDAEFLLGLVAAVEANVGHPMARAVVRAAADRGLTPGVATEVRESPGAGATGEVGGHRVVVGGRSLVEQSLDHPLTVGPDADGRARALVAVDGVFAGTLTFEDPPRPGINAALKRLADLGLRRQLLLSGDEAQTVERVGRAMGFTEIAGNVLPAEKAAWVNRLQQQGHRVLMVGDGINDAPALSAATVGAAFAEHGGGIAAEAADVVLLHGDPGRLVEAVEIGRRTLRVARQSVGVGLGLSGIAMLWAASGGLTPVAGALVQEGIDLLVIVNALRASLPPRAAS